MRKTLWKLGAKRAQVRGFTENGLVRVQWRVRGLVRSKSWPDSQANRRLARAFAEGVVLERNAPKEVAPLTLRGMWEKYVAAEFPHLRPRTKEIYTEYWRRWENMWGAHFPAEDTTLDMVFEMRNAMAKLKLSVTTTRETIKTVQRVYSWAERNEHIVRNKPRLYRFRVAKEERPEGRAEFRAHEFKALLDALDPANGLEWRPYVALAICGFQGVRQNAALHLQWADVDFGTATITWRSEWDKMGREWTQPLREGTRKALLVAMEHADEDGDRIWVLPARQYSTGKQTKTETYTAQSLWAALKSAEKRAGIGHVTGRGAHGLRRLLAGDVQALTGDPLLAMHAIGDTDVRQAERYITKRDERITDVFTRLDNPEKK